MTIKEIIYKISPFINHIPLLNRYKGKVRISFGRKIMVHSHITVKGINNSICFQGRGRVKNCTFYIDGDNNQIIIDENASMMNVTFHIEGSNNRIYIGKRTVICGTTQLACIEGTSIEIGDDCLFSANITVRTGDSHSVIDENGNRINPSKSVFIGNHVWVGNTVIITKGVSVQNDCVVGTGTVLTKAFHETGVIIAGNPGKIVKAGINWDKKRL